MNRGVPGTPFYPTNYGFEGLGAGPGDAGHGQVPLGILPMAPRGAPGGRAAASRYPTSQAIMDSIWHLIEQAGGVLTAEHFDVQVGPSDKFERPPRVADIQAACLYRKIRPCAPCKCECSPPRPLPRPTPPPPPPPPHRGSSCNSPRAPKLNTGAS